MKRGSESPGSDRKELHSDAARLPTGQPPWLGAGRDAWLADVTGWLREVAASARHGSVLDVASVRERPWGAVLRVTTTVGILYFKAEGLGARHEPDVIAMLVSRWPQLVPEVLAADDARSWLVMVDHGAPMWDVLDTDGQVAAWERVLPVYAELQAWSAPSVPALLRAGAPDRRMSRLPGILDALLAGDTVGPLPVDTAHRRAIDVVLPDLTRACEELAGTPVPAALDHGDLHGGNVLVGNNDLRLADWGDSCVTHPFSSLFVTFELAVSRFGPADRPAAVRRLRDAYLSNWSAAGPPGVLRETFTLAVWVGHVVRALDFADMVKDGSPDLLREWRRNIVGTLEHWLDAHPLLGRGDELLLSIEP